jgi:hypothetical protein
LVCHTYCRSTENFYLRDTLHPFVLRRTYMFLDYPHHISSSFGLARISLLAFRWYISFLSHCRSKMLLGHNTLPICWPSFILPIYSPLRPDGTSSHAMLTAHGHCILHGSTPQPSSINVSNVMAIHKSTCELCSAKPWNPLCLYTNWLKAILPIFFWNAVAKPLLRSDDRLLRSDNLLLDKW